MIRDRFVVLAFAMMFVPSLAFAQNSGSEADQEACTPDVFRLCQDYIPNEAPIVACLQAKREQLSPACSRVIFPPTAQSVDQPEAEPKARVKAPKKHKTSRPGHHAQPKHKKPDQG